VYVYQRVFAIRLFFCQKGWRCSAESVGQRALLVEEYFSGSILDLRLFTVVQKSDLLIDESTG